MDKKIRKSEGKKISKNLLTNLLAYQCGLTSTLGHSKSLNLSILKFLNPSIPLIFSTSHLLIVPLHSEAVFPHPSSLVLRFELPCLRPLNPSTLTPETRHLTPLLFTSSPGGFEDASPDS